MDTEEFLIEFSWSILIGFSLSLNQMTIFTHKLSVLLKYVVKQPKMIMSLHGHNSLVNHKLMQNHEQIKD
jgi:hypothetical protein